MLQIDLQSKVTVRRLHNPLVLQTFFHSLDWLQGLCLFGFYKKIPGAVMT